MGSHLALGVGVELVYGWWVTDLLLDLLKLLPKDLQVPVVRVGWDRPLVESAIL